MIQIFRNPIINMLLLNLNQTFWVEYISNLKPDNVSTDGLIHLNHNFSKIPLPEDLKSNESTYIPYVEFQQYFLQDDDEYKGLNPNIDRTINLRIIRTLAVILNFLLSFCLQLEESAYLIEETSNSTVQYYEPRIKEKHLSVLQTVFYFSNYSTQDFEKKYDYLFQVPNYCNFTYESVYNISNNSVFNSLYLKENVNDNFYYLINYYFCPICINVHVQHDTREKLEPRDFLGYIQFGSYYYPTFTELFIEVSFVLLSAICTLSGVIVYLLCPELRINLHGKSMMNHIIAVAGYYSSHAITKTYIDVNDRNDIGFLACTLGGATTWYFLLTTLFWLNSIFMDMLIKFWGVKFKYEEKKLLIYCILSWILPLLMVVTLLGFVSMASEAIYYSTDPTIVQYLCGLELFAFSNFYFDFGSHLLVRSLQATVAVSLLSNLIMTAVIMLIIHKQTQRSKMLNTGESRTTNRANTTRFSIYLKILSLTGFYWIFCFLLMRLQLPFKFEETTRELVTKHFIPLLNNLNGSIAFLILICTHNTVKVVNDKISKIIKMFSRRRECNAVLSPQQAQTTPV